MRQFLAKAARPIEVILGLVFLLGALLKAADLNLFAVQIDAYGVFENKAIHPLAAMGTLGVEMMLAWALLLAIPRRKVVFAVYHALLLVFTGLILYGWFFHGLEDCGCFGALEMSPAISIAKNLVLIGLGASVCAGFVLRGEDSNSRSRRLPRLAAAVGITALALFYGYHDLQEQALPPASNEESEGPYSRFVLDLPEGYFDLGQGEYLVALLSMSCEHCMEETPALNELMYMPGAPPLVALCLEESEGDMEMFRGEAGPEFPMYSLGDQVRLYFNLIGDETLGVAYVRDGWQIHFWDGVVPTYEELLAVIEDTKEAAQNGLGPDRSGGSDGSV